MREVSATFDQLAGDSVEALLHEHYLNFRNRYHFGSARQDAVKLTFAPLASSSLLDLARRLPAEELLAGRLAFDVTRMLCAPLAYHDYNKDFELPSRDSPYHFDDGWSGGKVSNAPERYGTEGDLSLPSQSRMLYPWLGTIRERAIAMLDQAPSSAFHGQPAVDWWRRRLDFLQKRRRVAEMFRAYSVIRMHTFYAALK